MKIVTLVLALLVSAFAQEKPEPREIGPGIQRSKVLERAEPGYTEEAREARLEGSVVLRLIITEEGATKDIAVVRGLGLGLDDNAVKALSQWKFEPARLEKDNTPVAVHANVQMNFRLQ